MSFFRRRRVIIDATASRLSKRSLPSYQRLEAQCGRPRESQPAYRQPAHKSSNGITGIAHIAEKLACVNGATVALCRKSNAWRESSRVQLMGIMAALARRVNGSGPL